MDCSNPKEFLLSVPYDYTEEMAFINNDILLTYKKKSINTGRLNYFLQNVEKGISDCVFITTFGLDGPATTSILKYDSDIITYTEDSSRFGIPYGSRDESIKTYNIVSLYLDQKNYEDKIISVDYHAITSDNIDLVIFSDITFLNVIRMY